MNFAWFGEGNGQYAQNDGFSASVNPDQITRLLYS
jgi:hypothetical protein